MDLYHIICETLNTSFGEVYITDVNVEGYLCDFFLPKYNTVILVESSEYQHSDAYYSIVECSNKLQQVGYKVLVLAKDSLSSNWESRITN